MVDRRKFRNRRSKEEIQNNQKQRRIGLGRRSIEYAGSKCVDCGLKCYFENRTYLWTPKRKTILTPGPVETTETANYAIFEFHHVIFPKSFEISEKIWKGRSWEFMKIEIDKCVLLCANCHRLRHQKNGFKSEIKKEELIEYPLFINIEEARA